MKIRFTSYPDDTTPRFFLDWFYFKHKLTQKLIYDTYEKQLTFMFKIINVFVIEITWGKFIPAYYRKES